MLASVCVCVCVGLDADLLAVIPAFSRHPSLKHLMLGKNFNIKGRYGLRGGGSSCVQMVCGDDADDECFPSCFCLLRVLDEILQKLVHLVQEEECVSLIM